MITASHGRCHVGVARGRAGRASRRRERTASEAEAAVVTAGVRRMSRPVSASERGEGEEAASCSPGSLPNTRVDTPSLTALYHGKGHGSHGHLLHSSRTEIITCTFHQRDWVQTRERSGNLEWLDTRNLRMRLSDGTCRKEGNINAAQVN